MEEFMKRFTQWQNYVHYLLNAFLLVVELSLASGFIISYVDERWSLFAFQLGIAVALFVNDILINIILYILLGQYYAWED